jgi:hypothetical protein
MSNPTLGKAAAQGSDNSAAQQRAALATQAVEAENRQKAQVANDARSSFAQDDPRRIDRPGSSSSNATTAAPIPTMDPVNVTADRIPDAEPTYTVQKESFPSDAAPYNFQVMFGEYNPKLALRGRTDIKHDLMITLPIPANLMSVTGLDYASMDLGAFGGEGAKAMEQIVNSANPIAALNELIKRAGSGDSYFKEALPILIRRAVSGLAPTVGGVVDLIRGDTPNPHVAVTFNSVKLRTFTYSWRMSPSSRAESEQLHRIIKLLHSRILPSKQSAFTLSYPNQCLIQIQPDPLNQLFAFKPAVVTDMSVNYAPSGIPSFFRDNMPTEVELSLSFQEIQIRTSGDYAAVQGGL